jgi:hypothetical protein
VLDAGVGFESQFLAYTNAVTGDIVRNNIFACELGHGCKQQGSFVPSPAVKESSHW